MRLPRENGLVNSCLHISCSWLHFDPISLLTDMYGKISTKQTMRFLSYIVANSIKLMETMLNATIVILLNDVSVILKLSWVTSVPID